MVDLDQVGIGAQPVQLELLLGGQHGQQRVPVLDSRTAEHQFVELVRAVSLFIDIHLQGAVEGMICNLVVVGESHDVVAQGTQHGIRIGGRVRAFVQGPGAVHTGVGMEQGPFPALATVQRLVRVEDVGAAECLWHPEGIHRADAGDQHQQQDQQHQAGQSFPK